jgi:signal peptidase II
MSVRDWRAPLLALSAAIIALDRWSKLWVMHHVPESDGIVIIPHVFRITHVLNAGAAFSLFNTAPAERTRLLLSAFSILAAIVVFAVLLRIGRRLSATSLAMALILGGAIGNVWDRIQYKVVTDFLEVYIVHYHWPDFNLADSAIVCGAVLLMIGALFAPGDHARA